MYKDKNNHNKITGAIEELSHPDSYKMVYLPQHGHSMPSTEILRDLVEKLREVIFPGYFGNTSIQLETLNYHMGVLIDTIYQKLTTQIQRGICFNCKTESITKCEDCKEEAPKITAEFISRLPKIRRLLATDMQAAYNGDPAAKGFGEIIYCYPSMITLTHHRIAHELHKLDVPLLPRIIAEMAHSDTGIDIHPAAEIGEYCAIDHGTGVVIGETCKIGNNVKIYQGVTLGAKSFPMDENGNPIKGVPRHPKVEDNVVIYANATILGNIIIGKNSVIGGNIWVTNNVAPDSKIIQQRPRSGYFMNGTGI